MAASLDDLLSTDLALMLVLTHDHRIAIANGRVASALGFAALALENRPLSSLVHPADRPWMEQALRQLNADSTGARFEGRIHHADGGVRWMSWTFARSAKGTIYAIGHDDSVRREIERAVRRREQRHRAMLDHVADPLLLLDENGLVVEHNTAARTDLIGVDEPLMGRHIGELFGALATRPLVDGATVECRAHTPSGYRTYEVRARTFSFDERPVTVAVAHDVEDRAATARELTASRERSMNANHAKSKFVSQMSHAMRTPLAAILGYTELLMEDHAIEDLQRIRDAADGLLALVDTTLDLARIETGQLQLDIETVDLEWLGRDLAATVRPLANAPLEVVCAAHPPLLEVDVARLKQILLHLLAGAIRHANGASVRLEIHDRGDQVSFDVVDEGPGRPLDDLRALFVPFRTGGRGAHQGAGLGWSMAKELAEAMGGQLRATSEPGVGSRFGVDLPRVREEVAG